MILNEDTIRGLLHLDELIGVMAGALADLSAGKVEQPVRVIVPVTEYQGFFGVMPAYGPALGAKLVTFYPNNHGMDTHHAIIVLFKPETGEPLVTMDGRLITEMRTAAVSAVATNLLARRQASVLAILGTGVQARSHLQALRRIRQFDETRVWSPRHARAFADDFGVHAAVSAEEAVRGADVVVVATAATTPVLRGAWLSPGTHINAVGAVRPNWRELDDDVLHASRIFVESRAAALHESGDVIAASEISAEIGEVVAGTQPGRRSDQEITLFKSVGVAVEDIAAADLVYRNALRAQTS